MSETPFYKTGMGRQFYERTLPERVKQIARLADATERLLAQRMDDADKNGEPDYSKSRPWP